MRPRKSSSSYSIPVPPQLRCIIYPPDSPYYYPPRPPCPPSPPPFLPPHKPPSRHHHLPASSSSSSECTIVHHRLIEGVYVSNDGNDTLYTKNLVPGGAQHDPNDVVISVQDEKDGSRVEYREWNPSKSKLAASILCGAHSICIKPGSRVLVLYSRDDEQFGITLSHISDIVGPQGMVYVVEIEPSNWNTLVNMADKRFNIVPIIHLKIPSEYRMLINMVDVLFAAVHSEHQAQMAQVNAKYFLKAGGHYVLCVKASCTELTNQGTNLGDAVFSFRAKREQVQFKRLEQVTLCPFDRDHAYVSGVFRMREIAEIEPGCLVSNKFWTSQDSNRGDEKHVSLYEKQKNLPIYMLFESSYGYVLFRAHDVYKVERNYVAIEEYIKSFDKFFEFIDCHTFGSTNDALMYLDAACNDTLPEKLMEFLVQNLPVAMEGDEHCYSLALSSPCIADEILMNTKIACSISTFHDEIIRGVRMNIDKFFKNMKPGDLEKAQLDLARKYCRQKLISPDEGESQKKRCGCQANLPTRKNPTKKGRPDANTNN